MNHAPKTLALLISLIGTGVAHAGQAQGEMLPPPSALELTRWTPGLVWREPVGTAERERPAPSDSAAALGEPAGLRQLGAPEVDDGIVDPPPIEARELPPETPVPAAQPQRLQRLRAFVASITPRRAAPDRAAAAQADAVALAPSPPPAPQLELPPTGRWIDTLAPLLPAEARAMPRGQLVSRVAARFPAAVDAGAGAAAALGPSAVASQRAPHEGPREVVVASPSERVLRGLEALLSRDAAAPAAAEPSEIIVTTQAEKVLATLMELTRERESRQRTADRQARVARHAAKAARPALARLPADAVVAAAAPTAGTLDEAPASRAAALVAAVTLPELSAPTELEAVLARAEPEAPAPARGNPFAAHARASPAIDESSLDRVRGGFVTENLNIAFGIERAVYINGALVTTTSLNLSELGRLSAGSGRGAIDATTLGLVQSGSGNVIASGALSAQSLGTVVQNTLDGQKIQNVTVINATVNSLGILRGLNLQSSLRGAVIDSLRR